MGDRISIQYKNGDEKSVVLFSHYGGMSIKNKADEHYNTVIRPLHDQNRMSMPLTRMEPRTVIVDFIRYIIRNQPMTPVTGDIYLGVSSRDGDNSDNGHWVLDLQTGKWKHYRERFG